MSGTASHTALYTAAQVRALDARAIAECGVSGLDLMQRAAWAAFDRLQRLWPQARRLCVLCGPGKNGGDGYLLALRARDAGLAVRVLALGRAAGGDAAVARARWCEAAGLPEELAEAPTALPEADVFVDALFGTGLGRPLQGVAAALVQALDAAQVPVLALDVPSGLCADTGRVLGAAVRARATVSFVAWKRGLFTLDGPDQAGDLHLATLDLPESLYRAPADAALLAWPATQSLLPPRPRNAHKGRFGHVLAVGGDLGYGGAVHLCAEAALRSGAGLVSVATRGQHVAALHAARPEAMVAAIDGPQDLKPLLDRVDVVALGPGLGTRAWGHAHWHAVMGRRLPTVIDADALNLLAREPRPCGMPAVLTPHPAEAARLLGQDVAAVQADRFAAARALARRHAAVVVLKGCGSLVAAPDGRVALCPWGNPGMASGGMGDVLTGVIAALLAQGLETWEAACLGVAAHARAGDAVAQRLGAVGLLAGDVVAGLPQQLSRAGHD